MVSDTETNAKSGPCSSYLAATEVVKIGLTGTKETMVNRQNFGASNTGAA